MTILAIAQQCAKRLQLPSPGTFIGSTDNNMILLREMIVRAMKEIRNEYPWPELQREHTFTLATSTEAYALPSDFDRIQTETMWNRTQTQPVYGPMSPQQWQDYKSGLITSMPGQRFRVKYWAAKQLYIDPTPTSSENGQTVAFEYISRTVVRPKTWVASTSWNGIRYCSYNGNIYDRGATSNLTTGTTAPTHTDGAVSDGTITWTILEDSSTYAVPGQISTAFFEDFNYDSDEVILNDELIINGAVWRFKQERGLDFEALKRIAEDQKDLVKTKLIGAHSLSLNRSAQSPAMIGPWCYPTQDYEV